MNIFIFIKYSIAIFFIIFVYYMHVYYFFGFLKSVYIFLIKMVKVTKLNNIKLYFSKRKLIVKIINFIIYIFSGVKFYLNYISYYLNNNIQYKNSHKNNFTKNTDLLGTNKLDLLKFFLSFIKKFKNTINDKYFFYKQGYRKNFYYNIFLTRKKKYTNWYWKLR